MWVFHIHSLSQHFYFTRETSNSLLLDSDSTVHHSTKPSLLQFYCNEWLTENPSATWFCIAWALHPNVFQDLSYRWTSWPPEPTATGQLGLQVQRSSSESRALVTMWNQYSQIYAFPPFKPLFHFFFAQNWDGGYSSDSHSSGLDQGNLVLWTDQTSGLYALWTLTLNYHPAS